MTSLTHAVEHALGAKKEPSPHEKELFRKAQDFTVFIRWIPGLRMVAVSNSLAMYATHPDSDIDLFIVTAPRRLWIVRTLVLIVATLLGVRTKPGDEAGKFCFPFFMTEENLSFKSIALERDIYLAYWIMTLKPLHNRHYAYGRFMEVNRPFYEHILDFHPSGEEHSLLLRENRTFLLVTPRHGYARRMGSVFSPVLDILEKTLGYFFRRRIAKKIPSGDTEGMLVNGDMIKLHYSDRRQEIRDAIITPSA